MYGKVLDTVIIQGVQLLSTETSGYFALGQMECKSSYYITGVHLFLFIFCLYDMCDFYYTNNIFQMT